MSALDDLSGRHTRSNGAIAASTASYEERITKLEAETAELVEALSNVFDAFHQIINEMFGGEMPCDDEEADQLEAALATLAKHRSAS